MCNIKIYEELKECYVTILYNLISFLKEQNITPYKYIVKINLISEKYIKENATYFIEKGLINILPYKIKILTIMSDENNINEETLSSNFERLDEMDLILETVTHLKQLDKNHKEFIKSSIEVLIMTLDKINDFLDIK